MSASMLIKEFGYFEGIALAVIQAQGCCVYCHEDLLANQLGYSSITMDHLLPKTLYPEVAWDNRNHVLACSSCNGMKGSHDPLNAGEAATEMLISRQAELIERVREYLASAIEKRRAEWIRVTEIVRSSK